MKSWLMFYIYIVLPVVLIVYVYRKQILKLLRRGVQSLRRGVHSLRRMGVQVLFIYALAMCVFMTALLAGIAAIHYDDASVPEGVFYAVESVFSVLQGESLALRTLVAEQKVLHAMVCVLSVAVPFFTTGTVLSLILHHIPRPAPRAECYYIFSHLNRQSLLMAQDLTRSNGGKKSVILFLRTNRDQIAPDFAAKLMDLHTRCYPYTEANLLLWHPVLRFRKLRFFFLSERADENFQMIQAFLHAAETRRLFRVFSGRQSDICMRNAEKGIYQQELYLLSETNTASMLIDNLRSSLCQEDPWDYRKLVRKKVFRWTELRLVDRYRSLSYRLLQEHPLYETARNGKNHVLILGFGQLGAVFFRTAVSFSSMVNHSVTFTLCDQDIDRKYDAMKQLYRECAEGYEFTCKTLDADSGMLEQHLDQKGVDYYTYIVVCLGDDDRNISVACRLKRYYRKYHWEHPEKIQPLICVNIENPIKSEYIGKLFQMEQKEKWNKPLHPFGTDQECFSSAAVMQRTEWRLAQELYQMLGHESVSRLPIWGEYERKSALACVCHAAYHVASVSKDRCPTDPGYAEIFPLYVSQLRLAEHRRWMDFVRSEGMQLVSLETAASYFSHVGRRYVDIAGQLTPCLEPPEKMESLYDNMKDLRMLDDHRRMFLEEDEIAVKNALYFSRCLAETQSNIQET